MEKEKDITKVIIVEDYILTRVILKKILSLRSDFEVCADFDNAEEALNYLKYNEVDLILMDIGLPYMSGIDASHIIKQVNPDIKILLLTSNNRDSEILAALFAHVDAYVLKDIDPDQLNTVIEIVNNGGSWIDSRIQHLAFNFIKSLSQSDYEYFMNTLDSTEYKLISMVLKGFKKREVAKYLNMQLSELSMYVYSIFKKLAKTKKAEDAIREFRYDFI
ncbi:response regulator transcription factor [bacterium]|nr:response regulator transcription factor [bacterium]